MPLPKYRRPQLPQAPASIQKGVPLKNVLNRKSIQYLARNILLVYPDFQAHRFVQQALAGIDELSLMERGRHIANVLYKVMARNYETAIAIIMKSLTPPQIQTEALGLAGFFYLPHSFFISDYGLSAVYNDGRDPFASSMAAQYALTQRFTAEFSIRPYLIDQQDRTLKVIKSWLHDPNPHVRRFCTEGTRPRVPWGRRIPSFIADPSPTLPILEALKDDESLYVRRSVANHLGDISKSHPEQVFELCERWLAGATKERKWLIRHALRYPAKKGHQRAVKLRAAAGSP